MSVCMNVRVHKQDKESNYLQVLMCKRTKARSHYIIQR